MSQNVVAVGTHHRPQCSWTQAGRDASSLLGLLGFWTKFFVSRLMPDLVDAPPPPPLSNAPKFPSVESDLESSW